MRLHGISAFEMSPSLSTMKRASKIKKPLGLLHGHFCHAEPVARLHADARAVCDSIEPSKIRRRPAQGGDGPDLLR